MKKVKITWIKSTIGCKVGHKRTIEALGLRRLNHTVEKDLTPSIKGMVDSISYLLKVEEVK